MVEFVNTIFSDALQYLGELFSFLTNLLLYIAIVVVIFFLARYLWRLYLTTVREEFLKLQEWTYLAFRVPSLVSPSSPMLEQIFAQIHATEPSLSFAQKYMEGMVPSWFSLEIVSLGGKISFIIRCPKKSKQLLESAIYAQYPEAEVTEVSDYLENISLKTLPAEMEMWGTELTLLQDQSLPLKTYTNFESTTPEDLPTDPLELFFDNLTKILPTELFVTQLLIEPVKNSTWQPQSERKAQELITGIKKQSILYNLVQRLLALLETGAKRKPQDKDSSKISDKEKIQGDSVLKKANKVGFSSLVRLLYLAPKESYDTSKPSSFIESFSLVSDEYSNGLAPNLSATPKLKHKISESLEKPYIDHIVAKRKNLLLGNFQSRIFGTTTKPYILNSEELATLYHLPLTKKKDKPSDEAETLTNKKNEPPSNLPIGEY